MTQNNIILGSTEIASKLTLITTRLLYDIPYLIAISEDKRANSSEQSNSRAIQAVAKFVA